MGYGQARIDVFSGDLEKEIARNLSMSTANGAFTSRERK
jgi:hypothetical protein